MNGDGGGGELGGHGPRASSAAAVAIALQELVADVLGAPVRPSGVHLDVDVLSAPDLLADERSLDSTDLIHLFTAIEDDFDIALADLTIAMDSLTLADLAQLIADRRDGS